MEACRASHLIGMVGQWKRPTSRTSRKKRHCFEPNKYVGRRVYLGDCDQLETEKRKNSTCESYFEKIDENTNIVFCCIQFCIFTQEVINLNTYLL